MHKIKRVGMHGHGFYEWCFTDEEREKIRDALVLTESKKPRKIASEKNISEFIRHLEFICDGRKILFDQPHKTVVRLEREQVLSDCKNTLGHLKGIERGGNPLWYYDTIDHIGAGSKIEDRVGDFLVELLENAWKVVGPLEEFIKVLEKYHRDEKKINGRPPADADHFIRKIRDIYIEHIGKPSATDTGPFSRVVRAVLEILGKPYDYPKRAIKAALKA